MPQDVQVLTFRWDSEFVEVLRAVAGPRGMSGFVRRAVELALSADTPIQRVDRSRMLTPAMARKLDPIPDMDAVSRQDPFAEFDRASDLPVVERDFYGKPLLPGYTRVEGSWWATHERRPRMWIGERDADGNALGEDGSA